MQFPMHVNESLKIQRCRVVVPDLFLSLEIDA